MRNRLQAIDAERALEHANDVAELEKLVRIELAADAPRAIELKWHAGLGHRPTCHVLKPGKSVQQPLNKARCWFGPFDLFDVYEKETDERKRDGLRTHLSVESARYLKTYDYPYDGRTNKPDMTPLGPHRSPDVTITLLDADGSDIKSYRLYEEYGIGPFEDPDVVAGFRQKETQAEVAARFEAQLLAKDAEVAAMRRELSEVMGMFKGFVAGKEAGAAQAAPAVKPAKEAVPA